MSEPTIQTTAIRVWYRCEVCQCWGNFGAQDGHDVDSQMRVMNEHHKCNIDVPFDFEATP